MQGLDFSSKFQSLCTWERATENACLLVGDTSDGRTVVEVSLPGGAGSIDLVDKLLGNNRALAESLGVNHDGRDHSHKEGNNKNPLHLC